MGLLSPSLLQSAHTVEPMILIGLVWRTGRPPYLINLLIPGSVKSLQKKQISRNDRFPEQIKQFFFPYKCSSGKLREGVTCV